MLTCSLEEFTTELLSSDSPESSTESLWADVMLVRTPPFLWFTSDGDCTFGQDKLIPAKGKRNKRLSSSPPYDVRHMQLPFNKFLSCSQCNGVNSSSVAPFDAFRSPSSGACSLSDGSNCSFASNTIWWLPLTSFWSSPFVVVAGK